MLITNRAAANIAEDIEIRERLHPGGYEGTDDARRYGAMLLGRALGHEGATLGDLAWYGIYAAAAYDGLNLCPTLHIMAAQAMDETRSQAAAGDEETAAHREIPAAYAVQPCQPWAAYGKGRNA